MTTPITRLDHFMLGFHQLNEGIEWFSKKSGVTPVIGGKHPGKGTQNALVSLGDDVYLEIIAPDPDQQGNQFTDFLKTIHVEPAVIAWATQTSDIAQLRNIFLASGVEAGEIKTGSRHRQDGSRLQWYSMFVKKPVFPGSSFVPSNIPFFLQWDQPEFHPSKTSPSGCKLGSFIVEDHEAEHYKKIFSEIGLDVIMRTGNEEKMYLEIITPNGKVSFQSRSLAL